MLRTSAVINAITAEYRRYQALADAALAQVADEQLCTPGLSNGNSLAVICWHVSGNLSSRFTEFLTSDGEKPWRSRDEEFASRAVTREELLTKVSTGWTVLFDTLATLSDADLASTVRIRGQTLAVQEALLRSLAHVSYHVGQIVYLAHALVGDDWSYLSIAPGQSAAYNTNPTREKSAAAP